MRRLIILFLVLASYGAVSAQTATPTATLTPTATPTPSATPDTRFHWLLFPETGTGTPQAQAVTFSYELNAGDAANAILLGALFFSLWAIGLLVWWIGRNGGKE